MKNIILNHDYVKNCEIKLEAEIIYVLNDIDNMYRNNNSGLTNTFLTKDN